MIPYVPQAVNGLEKASLQTGRTYIADFEKGRICGFADKAEALKQTIFLILSTERYAYPIYSRNYGTELHGLIGKPRDYCKAELRSRITEALCTDDRINAVTNFTFEDRINAVYVSFTAETIYGGITAGTEVSL